MPASPVDASSNESVTPQKFRAAWAAASTPLKAVHWMVLAVGLWLVIAPAILYVKVKSFVDRGATLTAGVDDLAIVGFGANRATARQWTGMLNWLLQNLGDGFLALLLVLVVAGVCVFLCFIVLARNLVKGRRYSRVTYTICAFITVIGFALGAIESLWSIVALLAAGLLWLPPASRAFRLPPEVAQARRDARKRSAAASRASAGETLAATGQVAAQHAKDAAVNAGQTVSATAQVIKNHTVPPVKEKLNDGAETLKAVGQVAKRRVESNETAYVVKGLASRMAKRAAAAAVTKLDESKRQVRGHEATGSATLEPGQAAFTDGQKRPDAGSAGSADSPRSGGD
ncbi:hypothetical protein JT358_11385 [Micrococcales bacterium 31B]|nr:hypothetical protein [Micrococcales bacterium 31B]